jgi:hypothetical protein
MKQPYVNFGELKAAVPIRRVLERYGLLESLRERGEALSGPCPFCDGETSFRVNTAKNCFHCFSCKAGGNMLDFVATKEDCSVRDAAVKVAEWLGVETSKPDRKAKPAAKQAPVKEKAPASPASKGPPTEPESVAEAELSQPDTPDEGTALPQARERAPNPPLTFELKLDPDHPWFVEAGIWPDTVREFGLGFCAKGVMGGRIAFPIRNAKGELVGYAGRWPGDQPPDGQPLWRYPSSLDLSQAVYPAERLAEADLSRALLAGDPLRVVLCHQLGLEEVFFVPSAKSLEDATEALSKAKG